MSETPEGTERLELILAFNRFADKADALLRGGTHQTVTLSGGSFGITVAVICCVVMVVALAITVPIAVGAYLDTRADIRQLENTDNAIRAYINTGKMPPAPAEKK
jgi:hypothetical protein